MPLKSVKLTDLWITSLLFDLNFKFINGASLLALAKSLEINKGQFITPKFLVLHKAVHFGNMFDTNLIWFYLCLVGVPQIAWSAQVNTTALDGKVIISGDHNEVVV